MERDAAIAAFGSFLTDRSLTPDQIEFVNLIVDHVTEHGLMSPARLWESPFTDISPTGPDDLFGRQRVDALRHTLETVQAHALA
jgi:type I restriction enzyme R subunit